MTDAQLVVAATDAHLARCSTHAVEAFLRWRELNDEVRRRHLERQVFLAVVAAEEVEAA